MAARMGATSIVAPFELIRTRAMAHKRACAPIKLAKEVGKEFSHVGIPALFRGLGATLMRDVP